MKTPHLGLMRAYGNETVFYKTASLEPRLTDQIGKLVAGDLLEKIARLPAVPGHALSGLQAPRQPMRSVALPKPSNMSAAPAAGSREFRHLPMPMSPTVGTHARAGADPSVGPALGNAQKAFEGRIMDANIRTHESRAAQGNPIHSPGPKPLQPTPSAPLVGTAPPKNAVTPVSKPPPLPERANPSVLPAKSSGSLMRPNANDFTANQGVTSSAPAVPAGGQVKSPLANPRAGGIATGGHAPNINDFTKQPGASHAHPALGRLMDRAPAQAGPPTINPMEAPKGSAPVAADKPVAKPSPAPAGAPAEASSSGGKGGLPWNRMLLTGGLLGAGALGLGAMKAGLNFLGGGHGGPANYGAAPGGYTPPMGVNGYGYPQMGTPLM